MKKKNIINDVHLGVKRMGGTTPLTQQKVQEYIQGQFHNYLMNHMNQDLIINGDLFDGFTVEVNWVIACYMSLSYWLAESDKNTVLYLAAGNHDVGKRNDKMSSFDVLASLLRSRFSAERVVVIKDRAYSEPGLHIIPHMLNQDIFNLALEEALTWEPGWLLLHANVDNGFAEESDHSLNVSREQLLALSEKHTLIFAHEHQARVVPMPGKRSPVHVLGNQWPTSIVDCLPSEHAQLDGCKYAHTITDDEIYSELTWQPAMSFVEMDWTDLQDTDVQFLRVTGNVKANQAAEVISAIAKYRQHSGAWVISNSVKVESVETGADLSAMVLEKLASVNILQELFEHLEPAETEAVKKLLEHQKAEAV